ncbi:porin [Ideonella paludis]|uniref:porin n=1 Tax=Ideonella paludis TaxID=1233411 RepID=UPI0028736C6A|nr:porin [Ideonella paludis]
MSAGVLCCALSGAASAQQKLDLHWSGFATVGAVHSDDDRADFVATRIQPDGAGKTREWAFSTDSRVGAQMNLRLDDRFEVVAQVVAQQQYDKQFKPAVEWLNLSYKVNDEWRLRLGRTALPVYMIADSRHVGYGMPWVRVPTEVYGTLPLTSNDGVDVSWRSRWGDASNSLQLFAGRTSVRSLIAKASSKATMGIANTLERGALTLRGSFARYDYDAQTPDGVAFQEGAEQLIKLAESIPLPDFQQAAAEGRRLTDRYRLVGRTLNVAALGLNYDPGQFFVSGEWVSLKGGGYLASSKSWYVGGGLRLGAWTPYASYSRTTPDIPVEPYIHATGVAAIDDPARLAVDALNDSLRTLNAEQSTAALGLRWDVARNLALKAQWERIHLGPRSIGRLTNADADIQGERVDVFSVVADYVF